MKIESVVEIRDLNFFYPDKTYALKDINFSVGKGERLGIVGPNGAGKSTLLLHLNGVLKGEGEVRILGEELKKSCLKKIRAKVGLVFQDPNDQLFMPTVFDDVAFGPINLGMDSEEIKNRVDQVLKDLKIETCKNKPPYHLSLGEKKKVSLATVLVLKPEVLVLDEPTVSLDPGTRHHFIELLKDIDATQIIASHDIGLIKTLCTRVVLMNEGMIVADGTCAGILENHALLEKHNLEISASCS